MVLLVFACAPKAFSQTPETLLQGYVSYANGGNIYVKFPQTSQIQIGDTLLTKNGNKFSPCILVTAKSSLSCVGVEINSCKPNLNEVIYFKLKAVEPPEKPGINKDKEKADSIRKNQPIQTESLPKSSVDSSKGKTAKPEQKINGRITAASYSNFSNIEQRSRHSLMGRVSFNIDHIHQSKFSLESYFNYRQNIIDGPIPADYETKFFRVYNLALNYKLNENTLFSLGRKINNKISSIGSIDGLQAERKLGNLYVGMVAGFRPDVFDYSLNTQLFQYGLFAGYAPTRAKYYSETTLGFIDQKNKGQTDRRYVYMQHSSRPTDKISLFGSSELDLFQRVNEKNTIHPRLTSVYLSLNYQIDKKLSLMSSYDSRKNIIYYESYLLNDIDRLLSDDLARQGVRIRVNYKISKTLYSGVSYSKRFQADLENKSDNLNAFITHNKLPLIKGNLNLSVNLNQSNYMLSRILSARYSRGIFKQKHDVSIFYRLVDYTYLTRDISNALQHYYGSNLSFQINKNWSFNLMGELSLRDVEQNYRINCSLTKRIR